MSTLFIVHCIDTEGPLSENLEATFDRLKKIYNINLSPTEENLKMLQSKSIELNGIEDQVAKTINPKLLNYNSNWCDIDNMLTECLSTEFRNAFKDDFSNGWVYSWHCMDHINYTTNPRNKDVGYGNIFRHYKQKILETKSKSDEINWHFHPRSINNDDISCSTSYVNSYKLLYETICRRIIDDNWFPTVNRPGFHSERQDSHFFLEQWIPFDYANQHYDASNKQQDLNNHRFGDWLRASSTWRGYHPSFHDYQLAGDCNRKIFRCLNIGTRFNNLELRHVQEAFIEAQIKGGAILAFCNHDYRDIRPDIKKIIDMIKTIKPKFKEVKIKFAGAEQAAIELENLKSLIPDISMQINNKRLEVNIIKGEIFGPQPFLALKHKNGNYYHDNLDIIEPFNKWSYIFDDQTFNLSELECVAIGSAGKEGKFITKKIIIN